MTVSVVNSYAAMADVSCPVRAFRIVDLPTDGSPTSPTVALPDFLTAKLRPEPPPELACFSWAALRAAILALSFPMWNSVALFFCVLKISASISLIWSAIVPIGKSGDCRAIEKELGLRQGRKRVDAG